VRARPQFGSNRRALRTRGFVLASAGILLVAAAYGALEGALPLHFATRLAQAEIAALLVLGSLGVGAASVVAGRTTPRLALVGGVVALPLGIGLAGAVTNVPLWIVAVLIAAIGMGIGETGALGILLEETGAEQMVLAMVLWSQVWAVGYFAAPAAAGGLAEVAGFGAVALVPLAAALPVGVLLLRR
jgi:MFS family permease